MSTDDRTDQRTYYQVKRLPDGRQQLIYRYARNNRLSADIIEAVYRAELDAGRDTPRRNNVTLGWLDGEQWSPADNPYARALSGLPKIRARIEALIAGCSPPLRVTGMSGPRP